MKFTRGCESGSRVFSTWLVVAISVVAITHPARAASVLSLDLKLDEGAIAAGGEVDFPLVLVDNHNAGEASYFDGWRRIRSISANLKSSQSTFVSFTPAAGFSTNTLNLGDSLLHFSIVSEDGVMMPDGNTAIDGRSELVIGTVRIAIGAPIPQDDGIGLPEPDLLLEVELGALSNGSYGSVYAYQDGTTVQTSFGGFSPRNLQYFRPEVVNPPVVNVAGSLRYITKLPAVVIRGTASGDAGIAKVVVASSSGLEFPAAGTTSWSRRVPLKFGWNQFFVYAVDHADIASNYTEMMIRRDKPKRKKPKGR